MPAPRSARAFKVPPDQLSGALQLVGMHSDRAKAFARAWDDAFLTERLQICKLAGAPDSLASSPWNLMRGDVQCFLIARFFVCFDVLHSFLQRVDEADV